MDTRTGDIYYDNDMEGKETGDTIYEKLNGTKGKQGDGESHRMKLADEHLARLAYHKHRQLMATGHTKLGRNDTCICGSGKKFKKCCWTGVK
jgi:uncharacterized protein YecA (UPF0149 family)